MKTLQERFEEYEHVDEGKSNVLKGLSFNSRMSGIASNTQASLDNIKGSLYYYLRGDGYDQTTPDEKKEMEKAEKLVAEFEASMNTIVKKVLKIKL